MGLRLLSAILAMPSSGSQFIEARSSIAWRVSLLGVPFFFPLPSGFLQPGLNGIRIHAISERYVAQVLYFTSHPKHSRMSLTTWSLVLSVTTSTSHHFNVMPSPSGKQDAQ